MDRATDVERRVWHHTDRDKTKWGKGEWLREPDKVQWVDQATGLDCLAHRNRMGAWCGYVGVPEGHPFFEQPHVDVDVHGGLTYAGFCQSTDDEAHGVCHVAYPGRPEHVWWLGFDCGHAFDLVPGIPFGSLVDEEYRTLPYVEAEVTRLALQLAS